MQATVAGMPFFCTKHSMTASTPSAPMSLDPVVVVDDWDVLLHAVTAKLRLLVEPQDTAEPLRAGVLECAAALEQALLLIKDQVPALAQRQPKRRRGESR